MLEKLLKDWKVIRFKIKDEIRINRSQVKNRHGLPNTLYILISYTNTHSCVRDTDF